MADTVTLWGSDGGSCNGPSQELNKGAEYILLHSAEPGISSYYSFRLESDNVTYSESNSNRYPIYDFPGCGTSTLKVVGQIVNGEILPTVNDISLAEFKNEITNCISGELIVRKKRSRPRMEFSAQPVPGSNDALLVFSEKVIIGRIDVFNSEGLIVAIYGEMWGEEAREFKLFGNRLPSGVYRVRVILENGRVGSRQVVIP